MNADLESLRSKLNLLYTDNYYRDIDLARDISLSRINLSSYLDEYRNSGSIDNRTIPQELINKLSPIVKVSQSKKFIQLTITENLYRDFSKHLSTIYKRNFKDREAYLLAQALAPAIAKNFYPQFALRSSKKYVFGLDGFQRDLTGRGNLWLSVIEKEIETLYTKGYMYALDENLNPIKTDEGRIQILKDQKGVDISAAPINDKTFKFNHLLEFVLDNDSHRKIKKSKLFSLPSSWKLMSQWEKTLVVSRTTSSSEVSKWSAEIAKERNPIVERVAKENTHSYVSLLNKLVNEKNIGRVRSSDSISLLKYRRVNKFLYPEKKNLHSQYRSGYIWSELSNSFINTEGKKFSENFETAFKERLENIEGNPSTGRITRIDFLRRKINNSKISKRLRGVGSISPTKRRPKIKKRRVLKFLDFLALLPGAIILAAEFLIDKTIFKLAEYVGERQELTFSLLRNVTGEGLMGRVLTSLDSFRFSFGVAKLIAKDGIEALVPGLIVGLTLSNPILGVGFGLAYFVPKFSLDFANYFSVQNPLVSNIIERIASTMTDRALSLPEIIFKSGTFGVTTAVVGTIAAALFGVTGLPLVAVGVGLFGVGSALKAVDLSFVGRTIGSYSAALDSGSSFLFKSEYLIEFGGAGSLVGIGLALFTGNPLFLSLAGAGLVSGGVADFFKSSLFEDTVLHNISGITAYDVVHIGVGFTGGAALIGFAFGGPVGAVIGAVVSGGISSIVTYIGKRGSRFIIDSKPLAERTLLEGDLRLTSERLDFLKALEKESLYREFYKSGYTSDMLDRFYSDKGIYEYFHDPKIFIPDARYIVDELKTIREDSSLLHQEVLRGYDPSNAFNFYGESINMSATNLEDFLRSLRDPFGRNLSPELIDKLSADSNIQNIYENLDNSERFDSLMKNIYREDIKDLAGWSQDEEIMSRFEKSLQNIRDGSKFGTKLVSREMSSYYKISDILKDPLAKNFIDPEILKGKLLDFFNSRGEMDLYNSLSNTDIRTFLSEHGLNLDLKYPEFVEKFGSVEEFRGFDLGVSFVGSDFYKFLTNINISVGSVFPDLFKGADNSLSFRELFMEMKDQDAFARLFDSESIIKSIVGIELKEPILIALKNSGLGALGKISTTINLNLYPKFNITTEDLFKNFSSGVFGGVIISVFLGVTNPLILMGITAGYIGLKTGLTILSKMDPSTAVVGNILSKDTIIKTSKFIDSGATPGLVAGLVASYFFGTIPGILFGAGVGAAWGVYRLLNPAVEGVKGLAARFMNFIGDKIFDPAFLVYFDTQLATLDFWKGLFFQRGIGGFLGSALTAGFGIASAVGISGGLAAALSGAGVFGALGAGIFGVGGYVATLAGLGVVGIGVIGINFFLEGVFGHGIFFYVGDFFKKVVSTIGSWFGQAAAVASLGFDILIGILALLFKTEFDIDDFLRTIFIMVLGWGLMASLIGGGTTSGGNNNNTSNTVNHNSTPASSFLNTSGKIINIENNPGSITADTIFVKTSSGILKINTTNPYLYKGETLYKGEYLGE